ncbi:hypothetical protein F7731_15065 [Cytobacillus depressus]|uniref:Uncharacterized protein n=1 Tax=Cytobacillus depressus TaxID=1602942 RepID=A0A6L3V3I7_9BACI|nr:hypothetical protein [Cytobacillus depressus]KAB2334526.1 hypothetical protein F7731_15065 [Cytobacillus depressus]
MKSNIKDIVSYVSYVVGFVMLIIVLSKFHFYFERMFSETYKIFPWHMYAILMYLPIGVFLGLPNFIKAFKRTGKWKINVKKLIIIILPMLFISFYWYFPFVYPIPDFIAETKVFSRFGMIVVGFILIDSVTKEDDDKNKSD